MPGGGAEILEENVRAKICPEKITGKRWLEIIEKAHNLSIKTNCTMLYGHIEKPEHRIYHLDKLRELQDKTNGFLAFIPLAFHAKNTEIKQIDKAKSIDDLKTIAELTEQSISEGEVTTKEMSSVVKDAKTINKILAKISNVVSQTTTLAVSGNIEAARAGEFGKGFAVVSSDIRNLALDAGANIEKIVDTMEILDEEVVNILRDWAAASENQQNDLREVIEVSKQLVVMLENGQQALSALETLNRLSEENLSALEQARGGSEQVISATEQARSNANESKGAAELIQNTTQRMSELVEELAVAADELQRG